MCVWLCLCLYAFDYSEIFSNRSKNLHGTSRTYNETKARNKSILFHWIDAFRPFILSLIEIQPRNPSEMSWKKPNDNNRINSSRSQLMCLNCFINDGLLLLIKFDCFYGHSHLSTVCFTLLLLWAIFPIAR